MDIARELREAQFHLSQAMECVADLASNLPWEAAEELYDAIGGAQSAVSFQQWKLLDKNRQEETIQEMVEGKRQLPW